MLGFLFGFACLYGIVRLARGGRGGACGGHYGRRFHGHHGHFGGHAWGDWDRRDRGDWGRESEGRGAWSRSKGLDFFVRRLFGALDTTPGQEKVIRAAVDEVKNELTAAEAVFARGKQSIIETVRSGSLDADATGEMFAEQDEQLRRIRTTFVGALAKISESLDASQREEFARIVSRWLGTVDGSVFRGVGPYRA